MKVVGVFVRFRVRRFTQFAVPSQL
jgi:hypothetical protein